jgi:hypothetical protein
VIAIAKVPLKEFTAVVRTLTVELVAPATTVSAVGDSVSEKSGAGTGLVFVAVVGPPVQDTRARHTNKQPAGKQLAGKQLADVILRNPGLRGHWAEAPIASVAEGLVDRLESDFLFRNRRPMQARGINPIVSVRYRREERRLMAEKAPDLTILSISLRKSAICSDLTNRAPGAPLLCQ